MAILTVPTKDELEAFVAAYSFGPLLHATGLEVGTVNTSFALELSAGRFFLRIYEEQGHAGAAREAVVLVHLASNGVATPAPIVGRDGHATRTIAEKPGALFPWVDGEILCQRRVTPSACERLGAALARIHQAGHAPAAMLDGGRFGPKELADRCARIETASDPDARVLADVLRSAVLDVASRRARTPSGLVHGDLFRDNVLWKSDDISALLDFESAHDGPFVYDIAVTILSWCYGTGLDLDLARAIVRGYQSVRELDGNERRALYDELILAALRFTITRITDDTIRVGKRWQRFVERRQAVERLGPQALREALAL